jgi:hypothetical protein
LIIKTNDIEYAMAGGYIDQYGHPYRCGRVFETIEEDLKDNMMIPRRL